MKVVLRGLLTALGLSGVVAATLVSGASSASASTIPNGHIQICAQGNYPVYLHVLSKPIPNSGGATTQSFASFVVSPGNCWWNDFSFTTFGMSVQADVVGLRPNGQEFYIGSKWWNSSGGLGIGAKGDQNSPWLQTW